MTASTQSNLDHALARVFAYMGISSIVCKSGTVLEATLERATLAQTHQILEGTLSYGTEPLTWHIPQKG